MDADQRQQPSIYRVKNAFGDLLEGSGTAAFLSLPAKLTKEAKKYHRLADTIMFTNCDDSTQLSCTTNESNELSSDDYRKFDIDSTACHSPGISQMLRSAGR